MPSQHKWSVSSAGVEPAISTLRAWRPLRRPTRTAVAQEGVEPSAFLFLREDGRPVAYRANLSSGSWNRTNIVSFKARQPTFSRSPRVSGGSRTRLSGMASPCLTARPRTQKNRRHPHKQDSVLGHHFSGHLPDPAIALLTGLGLFGLHPPRSCRYSALGILLPR